MEGEQERRSSQPLITQYEMDAPPAVSLDETGDLAELECLVSLFDDLLRQEFARDHASFRHVLSHAADIEECPLADSTSSTRPRRSKSVQKFSPLAYTSPDKRKPEGIITPIYSSCTLACDFCGADIFQSFFECQTCVPSNSSASMQLGDGILICPSCYVEGRTCLCETMVPVQCRPFEQLLQDRNKAATMLNREQPDDFLFQELNQG